MKRSKFNIGKLFYNDKFVMFFAILVSIILWFTVSATNTTTETHKVINDIPIVIELSQSAKDNDLMVFDDNKQTASVSVSGSGFIVSQIKKDDILVAASQAGTIDKAGTYSLALSAKSQGTRTGYEISQNSLVPQTVQVLVDRLKEVAFTVEDTISYRVDPDYYAGTTKYTPDKVTISGPESIVNKVAKVKVNYTINDVLKESQSVPVVPIVLYDQQGNILSTEDYNRLTISNTEVQADIVVLRRATVPVTAQFTNKPAGFSSANITVSPSTLEIAGPEETMAALTEVKLPEIDFSAINPENKKFEQKVELPIGCKNLSNANTVTVTVNMAGMSQKTISVEQFETSNVPSGKTAKVLSNSIDIQVVGPTDTIEDLTPESVVGNIDFENQSLGHKEMPLTFSFKDLNGCWVYGEYTVSVSMSDSTG